jgi:O-antigen/teichoic acid export membrane protein
MTSTEKSIPKNERNHSHIEPNGNRRMGSGQNAMKPESGKAGTAKSGFLKTGSLLGRVLPWAAKGGFALTDQALISGSNFVISILLARWLTADQYGAYAVAFGIFVLLTVLYQSLLLEPMAVFGGSSYRDNLREYLRILLWAHLALSAVICAVLGCWAALARGMDPASALPAALAGVTIASPLVLLFWLARRTFYLELSPAHAAVGALSYCAFAMGGLFLARHWGVISPFWAFLSIALAALVTSCLLLRHLVANLQPKTAALHFGAVCRKHWSYGRWALVANVASWVPAYLFYPLLSAFTGLAASGQLKALMNLVAPLQQTQAALGMLFLPYAARLQGERAGQNAASLNRKITVITLAGAISYWAVILWFKGPVFHLLYSGRYLEVAHYLPFVALGSILWAAAFGPTVVLRAMEAPRLVFLAYAAATVLSLIIGIPATKAFGLWGAILGVNLSDAVSLILMVVLLKRRLGEPSAKSETGGDSEVEPALIVMD